MKVEAENNDVKREENNNDNNNNNNNNESNNKIRNSSEGLSKPKRQMKMSFQLEMLEKAYAVFLSLVVEGQEGVASKEAAKGSGIAGFSGGGAQVGA
ncbi:hypothetical protein JHK84_055405 [Glycine max]|nr:hypothetical protein JHK86_055365 [Glycine max]KAG4918098.1 hypothetical protein JHK85_056379 [Glycine max]KAG5074174.1 hypothetical protein JHK84_055405 [Glycine max]